MYQIKRFDITQTKYQHEMKVNDIIGTSHKLAKFTNFTMMYLWRHGILKGSMPVNSNSIYDAIDFNFMKSLFNLINTKN